MKAPHRSRSAHNRCRIPCSSQHVLSLLVGFICCNWPNGQAHAETIPNQETAPPVRVSMGEQFVDWTNLQFQVSTTNDHTRGAWKDQRIQEQEALSAIASIYQDLGPRICITPSTSTGDVIRGNSPSSADAITSGMDAWSIVETRYHSAGFVEMDATLDLLVWLRPALASLASMHPAAPIGAGHTGLIVDARGLSHTPCFSPTLDTPDGMTIARAQYVAGEVLRTRAPVTYVTDPDTPIVATTVGENPLTLRAASASGPTLVLDAPSNETLQTLGEGHWRPLVANGRVVIVVEP